MSMRIKKVTLTGLTPLLMHKDNEEFKPVIDSWRKNPANKKKQVKGDDRSPAWSWIGCIYHDGQYVGMPSDCLMSTLRNGGTMVSTGHKQGTYKKQSQSGLIVMEPQWDLTTTSGNKILWSDFAKLLDCESFDKHIEVAKALGIDLFCKRARIGQSKHIRVRPQFAVGWKITGTIAITDEDITDQVFSDILMMAGDRSGLGDWRPSSRAPGPYGRFIAEITDVQ